MKMDEIAGIMQVYMLQNVYSNNNSSSQTSMMFELLLQSMMKNMSSTNTSTININSGDTIPNELKNPSGDIDSAIKAASEKFGVDADFIKSIIKQESSFNSTAVSKAGAMGLMQLMPKTAESLGVHNPFDVLENINGGTRYIRSLMDKFDGNKELALAAYNGGIGRMNKLGIDTVSEITRMPDETEKYVSKVMNNYRDYKKL